MDKIRLFLKAAVGEDNVEDFIKNDRWVEFPTRALEKILAEYDGAITTLAPDACDTHKDYGSFVVESGLIICSYCGKPRS